MPPTTNPNPNWRSTAHGSPSASGSARRGRGGSGISTGAPVSTTPPPRVTSPHGPCPTSGTSTMSKASPGCPTRATPGYSTSWSTPAAMDKAHGLLPRITLPAIRKSGAILPAAAWACVQPPAPGLRTPAAGCPPADPRRRDRPHLTSRRPPDPGRSAPLYQPHGGYGARTGQRRQPSTSLLATGDNLPATGAARMGGAPV